MNVVFQFRLSRFVSFQFIPFLNTLKTHFTNAVLMCTSIYRSWRRGREHGRGSECGAACWPARPWPRTRPNTSPPEFPSRSGCTRARTETGTAMSTQSACRTLDSRPSARRDLPHQRAKASELRSVTCHMGSPVT